MASEALNIKLSLTDGITGPIARINSSLSEVGRAIEQSGRQMNQLGTKMTFLGGAITGAFALISKAASEVSPEVDRVFRDMGNSMLRLQVDIATAVLPVFEKISAVIRNVADAFERMDPGLRNAIMQGLLIGGIFLTVAGVFLKFVGIVEIITGKLWTFITHLSKTQWGVMAIVGAVILMIQYWDKVREVVLPVISALEVGAKLVAIGFLHVTDTIVALIGKLSLVGNVLDVIITVMEKAGQLPIYVAASMHTALAGIKQNTEGVRAEIAGQIQGLEADISRILETGSGKWAGSVDSAMTSAQGFLQGFQNITQGASDSIKSFTDEFTKTFNQAVVAVSNLGQQSAQIFIGSIQQFSKGFGDAVANMIVKGKNFGESMKAVFENLAVTFISSVVSMITQWAAFQAIQAAFLPLMVSVGTAAASALSAVWAPVAAMVSLATMGGNAGPAMAAIASTTAFAYASGIPKLEKGGDILSAGRVLVGERGPEFLDLPTGARVAPLRNEKPMSGASGNTDINVKVDIEFHDFHPIITSSIEVSDFLERLDQTIARGSRTAIESILKKRLLTIDERVY